jgi:SAM-dependent methyltransferase
MEPMLNDPVTPRQKRERDYYDQYAARNDSLVVNLGPVAGKEQRPWNPYWHLFALTKAHYRPGGRLLDFGCGWGENTPLFAHIGYQVEGFDISENNLKVARRLAEQAGVADKVHFTIQRAEQLSYSNAHFDVVAGIDILHHVEIGSALRECRRVLRPGGMAFFVEPFSNPLLDPLRNTKLMRRLVPNQPSFERHITADERKLTGEDLKLIARIFPQRRVDRFRILSRLDALLGRSASLERVDFRLRFLPFYGWLAGTIVLTLRKESDP